MSSDAESDEYYLQTFFTILYARLLDVNPYCRSKVLQCYVRVFELPNKFPKVRHSVLKMAIKLLRDKSSNVRRNAVKLISTMVATHPFSAMHSGTLQLSAWTKRMNELKEKVAEIDIPQEMREEALGDVTMMQEDKDEVEQGEDVSSYAEDRVMSEEATVAAIEPDGQATLTQEDMAKLTLTLRFYLDAVRFITSIHEAADVITLLLASKNKQETIEAMDFFVIADAHAMECANVRLIQRVLKTNSQTGGYPKNDAFNLDQGYKRRRQGGAKSLSWLLHSPVPRDTSRSVSTSKCHVRCSQSYPVDCRSFCSRACVPGSVAMSAVAHVQYS